MKGPERDSKGKPTRLLLSLKAWVQVQADIEQKLGQYQT